MARKNALGKGLGALIEDHSPNVDNTDVRLKSIYEIDLADIVTNPFQPRTNFDEEALNELAISIKQIGIIQPITVRNSDDGKYQLISGERRLRAATKAGLGKIPAYVREANDQEMLEMVLVENIQRQDLDAIEIALSYQRLMEECDLTQEKVSDRVGKKRATIANYLRLLKLSPEIQLGIRERKLTMGHARSIITVDNADDQLELFKKIIKEDLSVRKTEELVRKLQQASEQEPPKPKTANDPIPKEYEDLKNELRKHFKTNVDFKRSNGGSGKIIIPFKSDDELERIVGMFDKINS
jgi:ParB family chromosome partitioning protein